MKLMISMQSQYIRIDYGDEFFKNPMMRNLHKIGTKQGHGEIEFFFQSADGTSHHGNNMVIIWRLHDYSSSGGDKIPEFTFLTLEDGKPTPVSTSSILPGKKVVLFAVPGAFTPLCSGSHCPSFVLQANTFKSKGVDAIYCTAVNDCFVMDAWADSQKAKGKITFLADGSGEFAKKIGMELDLTARGLGVRSKRYAMLIVDGEVKYIGVDETGLSKSDANAIVSLL